MEEYVIWMSEYSLNNTNLSEFYDVISTVRIARRAIRITVELRLNTSTHVLRALKWTTFCQGMQLKKYGHFGTGTSHQNPRFHQNV